MRKICGLMISALLIGVVGCNEVQKKDVEKRALPFDMPEVQVPVFKTDTFNIASYGAVADAVTLNTDAFAKAIDACAQAGGGVVLVPEGIWLTGPIWLKSNVNLHLENGALIQFSKNQDDYPLIEANYEGNKAIRCQSPVNGRDLENVAITGSGIIDGNGGYWRQVKKEKMTDNQWKELLASGGVTEGEDRWYPSEASLQSNVLARKGLPEEQTIENMAPYKAFLRPVMISLVSCKKVLLEGVTFQNSPAWNIHPLLCEHLTMRNLTVRNPWYSQNGDGVDVESCRIGQIINCSFDVGDDAICIKSGKDKQGRDRGVATELFVIRDCMVYHGHGGFVVGSEMSGGVRKMFVENCTFLGTDCGLRFKSLRGRGGVVEDIYMNNIRMTNIPTEAIRFNLYYGGKSASEDPLTGELDIPAMPVDEATPQFRNIYFSNILCDGAEKAVMMLGLPEMPVENIQFKDMKIIAKQGISADYVKGISFEQVAINVEEGNAVRLSNCSDVKLDAFTCKGQTGKLLRVSGAKTQNISLKLADGTVSSSDVDIPETLKDQVKF